MQYVSWDTHISTLCRSEWFVCRGEHKFNLCRVEWKLWWPSQPFDMNSSAIFLILSLFLFHFFSFSHVGLGWNNYLKHTSNANIMKHNRDKTVTLFMQIRSNMLCIFTLSSDLRVTTPSLSILSQQCWLLSYYGMLLGSGIGSLPLVIFILSWCSEASPHQLDWRDVSSSFEWHLLRVYPLR